MKYAQEYRAQFIKTINLFPNVNEEAIRSCDVVRRSIVQSDAAAVGGTVALSIEGLDFNVIEMEDKSIKFNDSTIQWYGRKFRLQSRQERCDTIDVNVRDENQLECIKFEEKNSLVAAVHPARGKYGIYFLKSVNGRVLPPDFEQGLQLIRANDFPLHLEFRQPPNYEAVMNIRVCFDEDSPLRNFTLWKYRKVRLSDNYVHLYHTPKVKDESTVRRSFCLIGAHVQLIRREKSSKPYCVELRFDPKANPLISSKRLRLWLNCWCFRELEKWTVRLMHAVDVANGSVITEAQVDASDAYLEALRHANLNLEI